MLPNPILLQPGGKIYSPHIGRVQFPNIESDPQPGKFVQDFYYTLEDSLANIGKNHREVGWHAFRLHEIIGASAISAINGLLPFVLYTTIHSPSEVTLRVGSMISLCCLLD
jgi:hypothetical protein